MGPIQTPSSSLIFRVQRSEPELVRPEKPTPHETKLLSDIDDQEGLRFHFPVIQFYKHSPAMHGKDPAAVIRRAVAKTLVYYYPLAGVLFIEADADVQLAEFGEIQPPFACVEELLFDVPGSSAVLHSPLLLIQVTRLQCGGFILALRIHHCLTDGPGLVQFMLCIAKIARGATTTPTVTPVWERHILSGHSLPRVTCTHNEYKQVPTTTTDIPRKDMISTSFFFSPAEISALRSRHAPDAPHASRFEILAACLWKCRTAALRLDRDEVTRMILMVNVRGKLMNPPLPRGYYGNALAFPTAVAPAAKLCREPLMYALDLVRKAKSKVNEEYVKSIVDLMVLEGRPKVSMVKWPTFVLSDVTRAGFREVDFGWGEAVYGGPMGADVTGVTNFCMSGMNKEGENVVVLALSLPAAAMRRFVKELENMVYEPLVFGGSGIAYDRIKKLSYISSAL
ncbi:Benzyl alcohol O-benzoyltransferase [Linum grandiflorum]